MLRPLKPAEGGAQSPPASDPNVASDRRHAAHARITQRRHASVKLLLEHGAKRQRCRAGERTNGTDVGRLPTPTGCRRSRNAGLVNALIQLLAQHRPMTESVNRKGEGCIILTAALEPSAGLARPLARQPLTLRVERPRSVTGATFHHATGGEMVRRCVSGVFRVFPSGFQDSR